VRTGTLSSGCNGGVRFMRLGLFREPMRRRRRQPVAFAAVIEVMLRNGRLMRVPEGAPLAHVAALADALESPGR
jgi:hypothetical protein